ncbi:MAG: rhomboid family intramembrane serine protease, partial [Gammaproteobacteria bacterium]|nr:rhomboid family intramembrane serine protease [Gammaproteobacteria bacterium]
MLIIPIHKKVTTRNFPAITALLVLINCLVFFLLQTGDDQVFEEALEYYFESVLPDIELPLYRQYLIDSGRDDPTEEYSFPEGDTSRNHYLLISMESDPEFMKALNTGLVVSPAEPDYDRWKRSRDTYEQLRESSFTQHYLLHYDEFNPVNSFTHMFMHGGMGHLLGNMLFLILLGILVEGALGGGLFLAAYLVAGLTAAVASLLIHWGDAGGMLGASGAIAGLMGLYTVLYGKR